MPRFYEDDTLRPAPASEKPPAEVKESPIPAGTESEADGYEEFDISTFDFIIADPGADAEEDPVPLGEAPSQGPSEQSSEDSAHPSYSPTKESPRSAQPEASLGQRIGQFSANLSDKIRQTRDRARNEEFFPSEPRSKEKNSSAPLSKEVLLLKSKRWLRYALRPSTLYENISEVLWPLFLLGSALFLGGIYLLIGMDWYRAELISAARMWSFVLVGLLVGATAALAFAGIAQGISLICRKERLRPFRVLSSVAGAAVFPSALLLLGLLIGLIFGVSVSMSFGIVALLWWIYTLMEVLRDLFPDRFFPTLTFLTGWAFALFALMSVTFTLK